MIDAVPEHILSPNSAAKTCPRRRSGKRPHVSCLYRWTVQGCRGIRLESLQVGGTRCTSREALGHFFRRLTDKASKHAVPTQVLPPDSAVSRALDAEGFVARVDAMLLTPNSSCPERFARICVGTAAALPYAASRLRECDILVAAKAAETVTELGRMLAQEARPARIVGLLPADGRHAPRDWVLMRCLFGFDEVTVLGRGCQPRAVETVFFRMDGGPGLAADADLLRLKRHGIWRHPVRNRRVARLAVQLARGDRRSVGEQYPEIAAALPEAGRLNVGVLTEGLDHAAVLLPHLPGARLVCHDYDPRGMPRRQLDLLQRCRDTEGGLALCTETAAVRSTMETLDVLIAAHGNPGTVADRTPLAVRHSTAPLLVQQVQRACARYERPLTLV